MYKMNPHSLDVILRKVRMPSKHCRVLSMLIRYRRLSRKKKTYILGRFRKLHEDVRYIARNLLDSDTKSVRLSAAAELAVQTRGQANV